MPQLARGAARRRSRGGGGGGGGVGRGVVTAVGRLVGEEGGGERAREFMLGALGIALLHANSTCHAEEAVGVDVVVETLAARVAELVIVVSLAIIGGRGTR